MTQATVHDLSDWLIVSDIDGTLNNKLRMLPKRNLKAIEHFVINRKGHFTLASGRSVASLSKHYYRLPIGNTPAIVLNGAGIYDFNKKEMIGFNGINDEGKEVVRKVLDKFPGLETVVFSQDYIFLINALVFGPALVHADNLPHKRCKSISEVLSYDWGKVVFMALPWVTKKVISYTESLGSSAVGYMSSSIVSYEMLSKGVTKGAAVMKLAEMLNIQYEHTGAIGDYFNDFDMLRSVFLPAACGQAPKEVRAIAKYHACHCNKGAVGDFLEYIENTYLKS